MCLVVPDKNSTSHLRSWLVQVTEFCSFAGTPVADGNGGLNASPLLPRPLLCDFTNPLTNGGIFCSSSLAEFLACSSQQNLLEVMVSWFHTWTSEGLCAYGRTRDLWNRAEPLHVSQERLTRPVDSQPPPDYAGELTQDEQRAIPTNVLDTQAVNACRCVSVGVVFLV